MWWTIPLVLLWVFLWVGIPMIIEMRAEKKHHIGICLYPNESEERKTFISGWVRGFVIGIIISVAIGFSCGVIIGLMLSYV